MRDLVMGHLGYIGPVMTRTLKAGTLGERAGYRLSPGARSYFEAWAVPDAEIARDIRDAVAKDFRGIDAVVHPAALAHLGGSHARREIDVECQRPVDLPRRIVRQGGGCQPVRVRVLRLGLRRGGRGGRAVDRGRAGEPGPGPCRRQGAHRSGSAWARGRRVFAGRPARRDATAFGVSAGTRLDLALNNVMAHAHATGGWPARPSTAAGSRDCDSRGI